MSRLAMTEAHWSALKKRLRRSKICSQFVLGEAELEYVHDRGAEVLQKHASDFVRQRLAPAQPRNEGRQTPLKGHPVFIAQHATGTCCRECLAKWHGIPAGKALTEAQERQVLDVIMRWIAEQTTPAPSTPPGRAQKA